MGLPPLAVEAASAAVIADFSVEYEDYSERGSGVAEGRPFPSDDKQGDISAIHSWGGFIFNGGGSQTGSRTHSKSSTRNNSTASHAADVGPGGKLVRNSITQTTQNRMHSSDDIVRNSFVEMS